MSLQTYMDTAYFMEWANKERIDIPRMRLVQWMGACNPADENPEVHC